MRDASRFSFELAIHLDMENVTLTWFIFYLHSA